MEQRNNDKKTNRREYNRLRKEKIKNEDPEKWKQIEDKRKQQMKVLREKKRAEKALVVVEKKKRGLRQVTIARRGRLEETLVPWWETFKPVLNRSYHLIMGFADQEDLEMQDKLLEEQGVRVHFGCRCASKQMLENTKDGPVAKKCKAVKKEFLNRKFHIAGHTHRHMLVTVPEELMLNMKNRNHSRIKWWKQLKDKKFKALTCEFHAKNTIHYLHCKKSQDTRDRQLGGFVKGTHVHYGFFDSFQDLLHPNSSCCPVHKDLNFLLHPEHDYVHCPCPVGKYKTETMVYIRSLPRYDTGTPQRDKQIRDIRDFKANLRRELGLGRQDSIPENPGDDVREDQHVEMNI